MKDKELRGRRRPELFGLIKKIKNYYSNKWKTT
jgi:hypothetical protein